MTCDPAVSIIEVSLMQPILAPVEDLNRAQHLEGINYLVLIQHVYVVLVRELYFLLFHTWEGAIPILFPF